MTTQFTNIAEIKRADRDAGFYWFSTDTVRAFANRVESRVYDGGASYENPEGTRLWVESTRNYDDSSREYKLAIFDIATSDISYVNARIAHFTILRFRTKRAAIEALEGLL